MLLAGGPPIPPRPMLDSLTGEITALLEKVEELGRHL
jgi:hypothetical protein